MVYILKKEIWRRENGGRDNFKGREIITEGEARKLQCRKGRTDRGAAEGLVGKRLEGRLICLFVCFDRLIVCFLASDNVLEEEK